MARVYAGEFSRVDHEVLEAVKTLPNDFFAFAEVNIGRNVDWLIIRASQSPEQLSTVIATELKRHARPLRGTDTGYWEEQAEPNEWVALQEPNKGEDINYYWQAVNTANAVSEWLWRNQRLYRESDEVKPQESFRAWPDLLILSPPSVTHRLPLGPSSRFGQWWYGIDRWLSHLITWRPRIGISISVSEAVSLADSLGLELVHAGEQAQTPLPSAPDLEQTPPAAFVQWLVQLEERIRRLEERLGAS